MRTLYQIGLLVSLMIAASPGHAGDVILQYYESRWETIEKKMPDAFVAGYSAFWFPPPGKADSGGFSVGYDQFDRFHLGKPFDQTLYGTEAGARQLVRQAHQAGLRAYFDYVPNHNGFRDASSPGFVEAGDYPGFVTTLPGDVDGDFHSAYASGDLEGRLSGLIDIAQEKNHIFVRHPAEPGPQNIPNEPYNPAHRRFYPDQTLPANSLGLHPFNLNDPMAGDPVPENATGLLLRNAQWMVEVIGADGFRIDAVKHTSTWFFSSFFDGAMYQRGRPDLAGNPTTPYSFGEAFTGDLGVLSSYRRKDGFGNRDVLDFPLYFTLNHILNSSGFADMRDLEFASVDKIDGSANDGSAGVQFVHSHDDHAPDMDNLGYAYILTRTGLPVVYFNALEFGNGRDFPKPGRGDALGGDYGNTLTKLVDASRRYAKGAHYTRSIDADIYVYERDNSLLVGLNDRGDSGYDTRNVTTNFRNITLVELSGTAADPVANANGDIPQTINVGNDGVINLRVPRNRTNGVYHKRGYVMYGPATPSHAHALSPVATVLGPEPVSTPNGIRRHTPLPVITADTFTVSVESTGTILEDNALIRLNGGTPIDSNPGLQITSGEFAGFEEFTGSASPREGGGTGNYHLDIDATALADGIHYLETTAFLPRSPGSPAAYSSHRNAFYVDREPPPVALTAPSATGSADVVSQSYGVVVHCPDFTADSMHIFFDQPVGYNFLGNVNGSNKMSRVDRNEFRFSWNSITPGTHSITIVAFEPTGTHSVTRFENIEAIVPQPDMQFGVDTNASAAAVNFQPAPAQITDRAYPYEFVIRVNNTGGLTFPDDFTVSLEVDSVVHQASPYNASLLPPINRLVQNDQNLSDNFDEFRFLWRGYGHNDHQFIARAELTSQASLANSIEHYIHVPTSVTGPPVSIISPTSGTLFNSPTNLEVNIASSSPRSVQLYLSQPGNAGPYTLFASVNDPGTNNLFLQRAISNYLASDSLAGYQLENGDFTIRVVTATGLNGTGLTAEASAVITVTGFPASPPPQNITPVVDGNIGDFVNGAPVLAVSAADGAGGSTTVNDYGSDGSLTELHGRVAGDTLYLAVRGDMFNGGDPNNNATIIYLDVDAGAGTGARNFAASPDLSDTGDPSRSKISNSGFQLDSTLIAQGIGFDAAVIIDGIAPLSAYAYGFGIAGVQGSPSAFQFLSPVNTAFATGQQIYPGAAGTVIAAPTAFEVAIPLDLLGNPNPRNIAMVVVTTADSPGFPSPNTLPESTQNNYGNPQTLDFVACFPDAMMYLTEVNNGSSDWVEFLNLGSQPANLDGWRLQWSDAAGVTKSYLLGNHSLAPGGYAVAAEGTVTPSPELGSLLIPLGYNLPWNEDRAGAVALIDPYGLASDFVRWSASGITPSAQPAWPGTAFAGSAIGFDSDFAGNTLSRVPVTMDTDTDGDWQLRLATPGAESAASAGITDWALY